MNIALEREKTAAAHGHPVSKTCEKCGDMPMMMMDEPPPPLGGATSFSDLKSYRDAQQEEGLYYTATLDFQDLQSNILNSDEMDVQEKAAALVALTTEFQKVVNNVDSYYPNYMKELNEEDEDEDKAALSASSINNLPDSAFAYIEPGGKKDKDGKTTPRSLRHFPIHDEAHVRNALARASQSPFGSKALPKIKAAAKKFGIDVASDSGKAGRRMSNQQVGMLAGAMDNLKKLFTWASYEDEMSQEEPELDFAKSSGFKLYETKDGPRWLTYSSNAFKDLEGELFTTAALEEAVEYADNNKERGPLRIFHVPGADIGDADYQAVVGRFLVESGTFRTDDLGQKAVKYFQDHADEDFQVSIGFTYKSGDEKDGVYDWLRIRERSITPHGDAANPFTSFALGGLGGKEMEERKRKMLDDIFGADLASRIVGQAETKSKELEEQGVSFKSSDPIVKLKAAVAELPEDVRANIVTLVEEVEKAKKPMTAAQQAAMEDQQDQGADNAQENPNGTLKKPAKKEIDSDAVLTAIEALTARLDEFKGLPGVVAELQKQVKELSEENTPRGKSTYRSTESNDNVLDPDKIKELVGDTSKDTPVNPVSKYVEDLIGTIAVGSN